MTWPIVERIYRASRFIVFAAVVRFGPQHHFTASDSPLSLGLPRMP